MSTRIRTFLKRPKYSFYPDWCGKGLSLFPTGEWFQNNVVLLTGFTGFVWTKLRPIRAKKERFDCFIERIQTRVAFDCKRTLGWKTVMLENFLQINRYFALTPHCNTIGQSNNAFSILGFSRGKRRGHVLSLHPLADKTNNENLPKPFFKVKRKSLYAEVKPSLHFCFNSFFISMNYTNWNFLLENHSLLFLLFCYTASSPSSISRV